MEDVTLPCWNKSSLPGWTLLYFLSAWFPRHPHPERTVALICLNWTVVTPCSHWRGNRPRSDHNDMNIFYAFFLMVTIKSVVLLSFLKADIRQLEVDRPFWRENSCFRLLLTVRTADIRLPPSATQSWMIALRTQRGSTKVKTFSQTALGLTVYC